MLLVQLAQQGLLEILVQLVRQALLEIQDRLVQQELLEKLDQLVLRDQQVTQVLLDRLATQDRQVLLAQIALSQVLLVQRAPQAQLDLQVRQVQLAQTLKLLE